MGSGKEAGGCLEISLVNDEIMNLFNDIDSISDGKDCEKIIGVNEIPRFTLSPDGKEIDLGWDQCYPDGQMKCLKAIIEKIEHTGAVVNGEISWSDMTDSENFGYYKIEDNIITEYEGVVDYKICDKQGFK